MTNNVYRLHDVLPSLVQHNMKHIDQFKDPTLGKPILINNSQDMKGHIVQTLFHPGTKSFTGADNRDVFYNRSTNTIVIINSGKDKNGNMLGGTAFRPESKEAYFNFLHKEESRKLGREATLFQKDGILALQPDIAREHLDQQKQSPEAKVAADKIAGQNDQQKNQDKAVSFHQTSEASAHKGQEKPPDSQQQRPAQGKNVPQQAETKNPETQKSAAGKPESAEQPKQPTSNKPAIDQSTTQKTQPDKTVAASGGGEAKTSTSPRQNAAEEQGKTTQPQVSKPETANQSKQQESGKGQVGGEKQTTPSANRATHRTSEAKNSPTGEPTKPDQQVTPQQPSSEAKTNQSAVSQSQATQPAGRSEALQKIYDRQQPNQSERTVSTQSAAEQKTGPENQQNQQSARVGNKDQAAVKDQSSKPDQQVTQQKTDAASPKENTQQPSPAQPPQSAKAEEGKAEKQEQSGQSQALQDMYQRQEQQQAQATEAPQQQSSAPEMG